MGNYGRSTRRAGGVVLGPAVRFAKSDGENLTKGQQVCFGDWFAIRFRLPDDLSRGRWGLGLVSVELRGIHTVENPQFH